jgi:hypothetical protein
MLLGDLVKSEMLYKQANKIKRANERWIIVSLTCCALDIFFVFYLKIFFLKIIFLIFGMCMLLMALNFYLIRSHVLDVIQDIKELEKIEKKT